MRHFLIYLAVVTVLASALAQGGLNVEPGHVYEVNLLVQYPIGPETSWAGVYGDVSVSSPQLSSYYDSAFGYVEIGPSDVNEVTSSTLLNARDQLVVTDLNNWFIAFSENDDVNFGALTSTCDQNLDALLSDGNFCDACTPNKTFDQNAFIIVDDKNYCARSTEVYTNVPVYVLLAPDGNVVYLARIGTYTILGNSHNFGLLVSLPGLTRFYVYLVPSQRYCGDGICESDETTCSDCLALQIDVTPTSRDANIGQSVQYIATFRNRGFYSMILDLSLELASGDVNSFSGSLSTTSLALNPGAEANVTVTASGGAAGDYVMYIFAYDSYRDVNYTSPQFTLHVLSPPPPEENAEAPPPSGVAGEGNVPTEVNEVVQLETGGFYIPWARCISNIGLSGPDRVNSKLEENVAINLLVQNGGTCEENVEVNVEISPKEDSSIEPTSFTLRQGEGKRVVLHVVPKTPGLHRITVYAKGLVTYTHRMELMVSKERATVSEECESSVLIVSPERIAVMEGEDINTVMIRNLGTCRERAVITLVKKVRGTDVVLDKKEVYVSKGETYHYIMPRLAAGEYTLTIKVGDLEKTSQITVTPKPLFSGVVDIMGRARLATLAFLLLLLVVLAGYLRYRYLR
ncbi:MAG: hypothetical protein PWQ11_588 [Candidatus Diapherotrites archaeon]|nr:hypothetical protein [Candidatus Diapherotrites archaeon]